jgi:hypothetical protein
LKNKQLDLFAGNKEAAGCAKEWQNMPEFVQDDLTSHRKIVLHFRNDGDVERFAKLICQDITPKQPSTWFPVMPPRRYAHLVYNDEP